MPTTEFIRSEGMGGGVGGMVSSIKDDGNGGDSIISSHANHRGDVIARSNESRSLTSFALYEAYGTRPYEWGDDPDRQKANTKEEETDLGLLNEGMRFRDLETGTFLTRDPIRYGDGPNIYCYVHCNPVMNFDPFGLALKKYNGGMPAVTPVSASDLRSSGADTSRGQNGATTHGWDKFISGFANDVKQQEKETDTGKGFSAIRDWVRGNAADKSTDVFGQMNPTVDIWKGLEEGSAEYERVYKHENDHVQNGIEKWNALADELNGAPKPSTLSQSAAFNKYADAAHDYYKSQRDSEDARLEKQANEDYIKGKGEGSLDKDSVADSRAAINEDITDAEASEESNRQKYEEAKGEYESTLESDDD